MGRTLEQQLEELRQIYLYHPQPRSVRESYAKQSLGTKTMANTIQQQLQESQTELAAKTAALKAVNAKLAEAEKATKKATAQTEIVKMLSESKLPEKAQKRLRKQFGEAVSVEGVTEAIETEREYIKSIAGPAKVRNMGKEQNEASDKKVNLVESFKRCGLSEAEARIAASIQIEEA